MFYKRSLKRSVKNTERDAYFSHTASKSDICRYSLRLGLLCKSVSYPKEQRSINYGSIHSRIFEEFLEILVLTIFFKKTLDSETLQTPVSGVFFSFTITFGSWRREDIGGIHDNIQF